jgi:F-type H+-transporting ATPase subunit gamma
METLESLKRKLESAGELQSVVRTMKAMAASNIGQYEMANASLIDYFHTIEFGIKAWFNQEASAESTDTSVENSKNEPLVCAMVFGSGQGLVGQFNDRLVDFVKQSLGNLGSKKMIWAAGDRIRLRLINDGYETETLFQVPNAVNGITSLVGKILLQLELYREKYKQFEFYIFHNQPIPPLTGETSGTGYKPVMQRLYPMDKRWENKYLALQWPTQQLPQVVGSKNDTLAALIREYFFVSIYKACAESLASENASRLEAMQRAEKNIEELLEEFSYKFHHLRQLSIDEELFDVVAGFEAMKKSREKK